MTPDPIIAEVVETKKPERPRLYGYAAEHSGVWELFQTREPRIQYGNEVPFWVPGTADLAAAAAEKKRKDELWRKAVELAKEVKEIAYLTDDDAMRMNAMADVVLAAIQSGEGGG